MAGILDNKSRVLDIIITREGKRQMSSGKMTPSFISFSDGRSFYEFDAVSGSSDASERIYFQAFSQGHDSIVFESDDSGQLIRYDGGPLTTNREAIFKKVLTGSSRGLNVLVSGSSEFSSIAKDLLSGSMKNFNKLNSIGDQQDVEDDEFRISKDRLDFKIDQFSPIPLRDKTSAYIDEIKPVFLDKRLSHAANFAFMPPVGEFSRGRRSTFRPLGEYTDLREFPKMRFEDILNDLLGGSRKMLGKDIKKKGAKKPIDQVDFTNTSETSNTLIQIFESNNSSGTIKKLDVINFGRFLNPDLERSEQEVFYAGKIFLTKSGLPTFVNIFTIIID